MLLLVTLALALIFAGLGLSDYQPGDGPVYLFWLAGLTGYFYLVFRWPLVAIWPGVLVMAGALILYAPAVTGLPPDHPRQEIVLECLPSESGRVALRVTRPGQLAEMLLLEGEMIHPLYVRVEAHPLLFWKRSRSTWLAGIATEPVWIPGMEGESPYAHIFPEFRELDKTTGARLPGLLFSYPPEEVLLPGDYYRFTLIPGGREPEVRHR